MNAYEVDYEGREQEFAEADDGLEVDGGASLIIAWGQLGERLIMDKAIVQTMMTRLYKAVHGCEVEEDEEDWVELWSLNLNELRVTQLFTTLKAYGRFGLWPDGRFFGVEAECDIDSISEIVGMARELMDSLPASWGPNDILDEILLAAEGRLALDSDGSLTPEQLAALGQVGVRSIKNLMTPKNARSLRTTEDGRIPAGEALRWLQKRESFRTSIWHERRAAGATKSPPENNEIGGGEVLFVPVAKDGSIFDPEGCCRDGRYVVGAKGAERIFGDYREALEALMQMPVPRWRRPNDKGSWAIVRADGDRWLRRTAGELGLAKLSH